MSRISIKNVTFSYSGNYENVFENLNLNLDTKWKLGLIGRNGKGKSTLLKLINNELKPNIGEITKGIETEKFPYDILDESLTVLEVIKDTIGSFRIIEDKLDSLNDSKSEKSAIEYASLINFYNDIGGYQVESLIEKEFKKMELDLELLNHKYFTLSGGEKTKIKIISLFLKGEKFLLIDEPTNHLDIFGRAVLSNYLKNKSGYILVSHDQEFIDSCVDHILSINKNSIKLNKCGFAQWDTERINNEKMELKKRDTLLNEAEKLESSAVAARGWSYHKEKSKNLGIDSGFVSKRSAKMMKRAKSMEKRMNKRLEDVKALLSDYEKRKELEIKQEKLSNKRYLGVYDISYNIEGNEILKSISFNLEQGDRLWIKGENGSGKTTLLKMISGELKEDSGYIKKYNGVNITHSHQDISRIDLTVEEYRRINGSDKTVFLTILDYFEMNVDYLNKRIDTLSEGEKKKVEIAKTLANTSEIYLWDEILNYMDIYFRIQIEEAIFKYNPTLIFVSHDEAFSKKIATKILDLDNNTLEII